MKSIRFAQFILAFAFLASNALAQSQRTFVSGSGDDQNDCSRLKPCRRFDKAISQTSAGGEVYVLDTAGYGPATINKSISIIAGDGATAGISVSSGNGITINAAGTDNVVLRGLTINSQGGLHGIEFDSGGSLLIDNCVTKGFNAFGIGFTGTGIAIEAPARIYIKDTISANNEMGVMVEPGSSAIVSIDHVHLETNASDGLLVSDGGIVTISNSVAAGNGLSGFHALAFSNADSELNIDTCVAASNSGNGVSGNAGPHVATVRVSNSTLIYNGTGLAQSGNAVVVSRGNNTVQGNTSATSGVIGSFMAQ